MKYIFLSILFISNMAVAQKTYKDSALLHIAQYVAKHEIVLGENKKSLAFYEISKEYRVMATLEKFENSSWFKMQTSGLNQPLYRKYGIIRFILKGKELALNLYQSQDLLGNTEYQDLLFLPFTDETSGHDTYAGGRYIDLKLGDIINGKLVIDFNKAYNPYCAYISGVYNCPIPPKENHLPVKIEAGEKEFSKSH